MPNNRIVSHPIIEVPGTKTIKFYWKNEPLEAKENETIASALIANGIDIFGHHPKDHSPLGLFCANGQCSQCLVLVDGKPIKSCMTKVKHGMSVMPADGLPNISNLTAPQETSVKEESEPKDIIHVPVLIIGGGPAGLSAAIELGNLGVEVLLVDDKASLGGKLVLQTHRFFGSTKAVYAGTRGIDIAKLLSEKVEALESVNIMLETTAVAIFEEKTIGLWQTEKNKYLLVKPDVLLVATGARERSLPFQGNTLPGIFGAGAFQTLVNRDLVKPTNNLFIVGGGNVGLIAGYHALQSGINVVGLVEALPSCGGYKVHEDKLARFGVPIYISHTILEARGENHVKSVLIAEIDKNFQPIEGTKKEIQCDCVLIAVGLNPVDEFLQKAKEVGLPVFAAGDAEEIAEASAAMYSGKIRGLEIAGHLGCEIPEIPEQWREFEMILKSRPGKIEHINEDIHPAEVFPVMHCRQEIPCDPCASVCPKNLIRIDPDDIRGLPEFCDFDGQNCIACERCVAVCPGLAITLVDFRKDSKYPTVSIPLEFSRKYISVGDNVPVTDVEGSVLARVPVTHIREMRQYSHTLIVRVKAPSEIATKISGIRLAAGWNQPEESTDRYAPETKQENIVCRCEHISADTIRELIRGGVRDINQIKAATKATMGSCGGKTCLSLIKKIFREEGIPIKEVTEPTHRPVFVEMPIETLAKNHQEV